METERGREAREGREDSISCHREERKMEKMEDEEDRSKREREREREKGWPSKDRDDNWQISHSL